MSAEAMPVQAQQQSLVVTRNDVDELKKQRELLREFVSSQLVEASFDKDSPNYGEGDYGIIPGTRKRCLFKQGAEKMQKLFRLGCHFTQISQELDRKGNFAFFVYRAEVYDLRTGVTIADCEGSSNSQEVRYKERTVWKKNKKGVRESVMEETPICDVLNTLMKMAQKRAMIGATILATGASEYFTQDMLEPEDLAEQAKGTDAGDAKGKKTEPAVAAQAPVCCGREMMVSKYDDKELGPTPWFCGKCRNKIRRSE